MRIACIGAGAIGALIAGYLKLKKEEVFLVGHSQSVRKINLAPSTGKSRVRVRRGGIKDNVINISGVRGEFNIKIDIFDNLNESPDLVILSTKTQDIKEAIKDNLKFLKGSIVLTVQNGIQADRIVSKYIARENIISSIVMFGSTYLEDAKIFHNFEGKWVMGRIFSTNDKKVGEIAAVLNNIFPVVITDNILGMKYLKLFVNANNCLAAIIGKSMQETFSDLEICKISMRIWQEGLDIVNKAGIKLVSLPDFPLERLTKLASLPLEESARIFSGIMTNLSKEPLYGSILQSIKRGKPSEIDYINGEFLSIAKANNLSASLNEKLTQMVHEVERTGSFFTKEELINSIKKIAIL